MNITIKSLMGSKSDTKAGIFTRMLTCECPSGLTALECLRQFDIPTDENSVILVNGMSGEEHKPLHEGDVIFIFPSIAGG